MTTLNIRKVVDELDQEIASLKRARQALVGLSTNGAVRSAGRPAWTPRRTKIAKQHSGRHSARRMSAAGRARIAAAQRTRLAKVKKAQAA